jgi:hypothetical protein
MVARRVRDDDTPKRPRKPATTPEGRENQLVSKAFDLAEKQIDDGTASAQVITHFLKLGSRRDKLEQYKIELENELLQAKTEALASQARVEELYAGAINAMRSYAGQEPLEEDDEYDD